MEELYQKVFRELDRQRVEDGKRVFSIEDVGSLVYQSYYDDADEYEEEIDRYAHIFWERFEEYLKALDPDLEVLDDCTVGLTGWDAWIDEEDEWTEEEEAEYQKNLEWLQNIVDEVVEEVGDDEEEDEEDSPTARCEIIEEHITNLLDGEGDEVYDEYTTIALSEDKESVIVTRGIEQESTTFKISDYKDLTYLVIDIDKLLYPLSY
jgi:hypothetical protein